MPLKTGLGGSLGAKKEAVYGTYLAPDRHFPITSANFKRNQDFYKSKSLQAGIIAQQSALVTPTTRTADGNINMTASSKGLGLFLDLLHGNTVTPTGALAAKTQVHEVGLTSPDGKSGTFQAGIPDTAGVVQPQSMIGSVVETFKMSSSAGEALELEVGLAAQDLRYSDALATTVYPSGYEIFSFMDSTLTFDGAATGSCVKSFEATLTIPRVKDRFCLNGSGTALEMVVNDHMTLAGTMTMEFTGLTQVNAFINSSWRALKLRCLGKIDIAAATKAEFTLDVANFLIEDASPQLAGPGLVTMQVNWTAAITGANPLGKYTYVSTDIAV